MQKTTIGLVVLACGALLSAGALGDIAGARAENLHLQSETVQNNSLFYAKGGHGDGLYPVRGVSDDW